MKERDLETAQIKLDRAEKELAAHLAKPPPEPIVIRPEGADQTVELEEHERIVAEAEAKVADAAAECERLRGELETAQAEQRDATLRARAIMRERTAAIEELTGVQLRLNVAEARIAELSRAVIAAGKGDSSAAASLAASATAAAGKATTAGAPLAALDDLRKKHAELQAEKTKLAQQVAAHTKQLAVANTECKAALEKCAQLEEQERSSGDVRKKAIAAAAEANLEIDRLQKVNDDLCVAPVSWTR